MTTRSSQPSNLAPLTSHVSKRVADCVCVDGGREDDNILCVVNPWPTARYRLTRRIDKSDGVAMHLPDAEPWVHPVLEVRLSAIAERGLFARDPLAVGERVIRFGGRIVTDGQLVDLFAKADHAGRYVDTLHVDIDSHLVLPDASIAHFGNHSCDPNVWLEGPFNLVARRKIHRDEEVTVDYATFSTLPDFAMMCHCAASSCRARVTGNDWQLPELQHRYGDHWSPAAMRLISAQL